MYAINLTIADLRAMSAPDPDSVYQITDYGGGHWYYDPIATGTDDTGTVIVSNNGKIFKRIYQDYLTSAEFGAKGDNSCCDADALQALFNACAKAKKLACILPGTYKITKPLNIKNDIITDGVGVSIKGLGSFRNVIFLYSGTGYCLNIEGQGKEKGKPITKFTIENIFIEGDGNSISEGGFSIKRCYIFRLINCGSAVWNAADASALVIRNAFNAEITGGNYTNGTDLGTGGSVVVVGSEKTLNAPEDDSWNTSNVQFRNTLIQRGAKYGIKVEHDGNVFDNLYIENVSFGSNKLGSIYCCDPYVNNITMENCHFEGGGYSGEGIDPTESTHITIISSACVNIINCEIKNAATAILLNKVIGFNIDLFKIYTSEDYQYVGTTKGIIIAGEDTMPSIGRIGTGNIYTNKINQPYNIDNYSRVEMFDDIVTESQWNATYANNALTYRNTFIKRAEVKAGNVDTAFQQLWTTAYNGTNWSWYRVPLSDRGQGWAAAIPTNGSYTQGDIVYNRNPSLQGTAPFQYIVAGWERLLSGSSHILNTDWAEKRHYIALPTIQPAANGGIGMSIASGAPGNSIRVNSTGNGYEFYNPVIRVSAPLNSTVTGALGQIAMDSNYFYWYDGSRWQRVAKDGGAW